MANAAMLACTESGRQPSAICIKLGIPTAFHWSRLSYVPFSFRVECIVKISRMREVERLQTKGKIKTIYLRLKRGTYERNRTIQANYQELS